MQLYYASKKGKRYIQQYCQENIKNVGLSCPLMEGFWLWKDMRLGLDETRLSIGRSLFHKVVTSQIIYHSSILNITWYNKLYIWLFTNWLAVRNHMADFNVHIELKQTKPVRLFYLFILGFAPIREFSTHVETSPLTVKGCKILPIFGTHGL